MANSADPDQLASKKPTDLDLHCLQCSVYLGSAGQGLSQILCQDYTTVEWSSVVERERERER